ncbi:flagellin [Clostridium sp. JN-9]|uniref:flagellin N-terminal helical domain-containing protein n=1 Tax=Clostridium sp. JN-9 TaxID=2507159 RepID=UPI000FFE04CA|nr:flagellin [Clostridium sp. JN-9]QAT39946.1 flagellin [Clostridium sp. JN-9]
MRLCHNLASLNIYTRYTKTLKDQNISLQRISSGVKLNSAKDDPNALAASERLNMQIRGMQMAGRNAQDSASMLQTAEGGLDGMTSMLQRARELVVQGANGTNTDLDKGIIKNEINSMIKGVTDLANFTEFNGVKILASEDSVDLNKPGYIDTVIGANSGDTLKIPTYNLTADKIGDPSILKDLQQVGDLMKGTADKAPQPDKALQTIDYALDAIIAVRSKYGALENRLTDSYDNLNEMSDKVTGAESSLADADISEEILNFSKDSILSQAANALMAQTNKMPQDILKVLENLRIR